MTTQQRRRTIPTWVRIWALLVTFCGLLIGGMTSAAPFRIGVLINDGQRDGETYKAAVEQLHAEGFGPEQAIFEVYDAGGDRGKAAEAVRKFTASPPNLILVFGTSTTKAVVREVRETPVVFAGLYDPVEAGVARSWKSSGNNTTGTSDKVPMEVLVKTLKRVTPLTRLGVLMSTRNTQEAVSGPMLRLKELKALQEPYGFRVVEMVVRSREEVPAVLEALAEKEKVEAVYVAGGGEVGLRDEATVRYLTMRRVLTIGNDPEDIDRGTFLVVAIDEASLGKLAGQKAVQILRGAKPADIPIELSRRYKLIVNMKAVRATGLQVPLDLLQSASRVVQ